MKKYMTLLMICFVTSAFAQTAKISPDAPEEIPPCPNGYCPSLNIHLSLFNLRKPRTDCTSGLGICIRLQLAVECHPCGGKSRIEGEQLLLVGQVEQNRVILHLPAGLEDQEGFSLNEQSLFEVEEGDIQLTFPRGNTRNVRGGAYPLRRGPDGWLVTLDLM